MTILLLGILAGLEPQFDWPAAPVPGEADIVNPACLAWHPDLMLAAGFQVSDSSFERFDGLALAAPGFGFRGYWNDAEGLRSFTIGSGSRFLRDMLAAGTSYTWFDPTRDSEYEGKGFWTFGVSARPLRWMGLGIVRRGGFTSGNFVQERLWKAGLALRPAGRAVTLLAGLSTGESFEDVEYSGGVELRPMEGLALRFDGGSEGFRAGISTDFGNLGLGGSAAFDEDDGYAGARGQVRLSSSPRGSLLPPPCRFVRIEPGNSREERTRGFFGPSHPSFTEDALLLSRMAEDGTVDGVLVEIDGDIGSPAQAEEVRELLSRVRAAGKPVYIYMTGGSNFDLYLASVGTDAFLHPAGEVGLIGLSEHCIFLRDMLDGLGVYPDLFHIGDYKSASEMFTRPDISEAQVEAETALLEAFERELFRGITDGMGLEGPQIRALLERGPCTGADAPNLGLADGILFPDELEERMETDLGRGARISSLDQYRSSIPVEEDWGPEPHVAVVVATGMITRGESGNSFPLGRTMGSETMCEVIERAASAPGVKALVLRVDSPGGDAFASEEILHALDRASERIPVVVSMGAVAGSGGYYIACGADSIFADALTVTGSIGVITGKFAIAGLLDRLGVNVETLTSWPMADMGSIFSPYTPEQRDRMQALMQDSYDLFVNRVAEGRGMTFEEVQAVAQGRVWAGADAVERGLVDRLGGVVDAVECAWRMAGMDPGDEPAVAVYPQPGLIGSLPVGPLGGLAEAVEVAGRMGTTLYLAPVILVE